MLLTNEEAAAVDFFKETTIQEADGRYSVSLPRKQPWNILTNCTSKTQCKPTIPAKERPIEEAVRDCTSSRSGQTTW